MVEACSSSGPETIGAHQDLQHHQRLAKEAVEEAGALAAMASVEADLA
eukprot:SAG31_NODE_21995_length_536_cov_0.828375_1_plen_47_part_10